MLLLSRWLGMNHEASQVALLHACVFDFKGACFFIRSHNLQCFPLSCAVCSPKLLVFTMVLPSLAFDLTVADV